MSQWAWRRPEPSRPVVVAVLASAVARAVVLGTLALAHFLVDRLHPASPAVAARVHQGLLGWDAGHYLGIASHGYGTSHQALRFFPLYPLVGRGLSDVTRLGAGTSLLVVSNVAAVVAAALLYRLARLETGDDGVAERATWLLALAPPAFVLVMGYSEPLMLVLSLATFIGLRTRRWWAAALAGFLAGLTRPLGAVLAVPAAIEALRHPRPAPGVETAARAAAAVAPLAGTGAYLCWAWARFGDALLPLRVQTQSGHRGGLADPLRTLFHNASGLVRGHHVGSGLHVPWVVLLVILVVVAFRTWPACYGALAAVTLAVALSSANLDSIERYALGAFPFVLVGASLTRSPRAARAVFVLSAAALVGYGLLAFLNASVP